MNTPLRLLVIEDNPADFMLLERSLRQGELDAECRRICSDPDLAAALQENWDLALADYNVPGMDFDTTLRRMHERWPELPVILVSGHIGEEAAVGLLRSGLTDFVSKGHLNRLPDAIRRALGELAERHARQAAETALRESQAAALEEQRRARIAALNLMEDAVAARARAEQANQALRESESKYRLVSDNALDFIFWLGADGRFIYASPACRKLFDHDPEEFLQDPELMARLLHPDDREAYRQHLAKGTEADPADLEFRYIAPDGSTRWMSHHCQAMYDEHGNHIGRRGSNRDITSRKVAEAKRDLLSEALRQTAQPLLLANQDLHITYINPAFTRLFGYAPQDLLDEPLTRLTPQKEHAPEWQQMAKEQIDASGFWSGEVERVAKDGTQIPVALNVGAIRDDKGGLIGFIGSYLDLRDLREKEQSLRKLAQAVEQSPESIVITDLDGNVEYVNAAFLRNSGYRVHEVIGNNPRLLQSGKTPKRTYDDLWRHLTQGKTWMGEFINKRKDGSEFIEHSIISPIRQPDGRITHYLAVKEDITEKKRAEAEIHRLAFYDTLTGLPNRALLLERTAQALATIRRVGEHSALILLNIDRFKTINDAGGQSLGDELIKALGERLSSLMHEGDVVARLGGDEFCLLLSDLAAEREAAAHRAMRVSERIHDSLLEPFRLGRESINVTACLGIALFPAGKTDVPLEILRRANTALHHAKTRGHGQSAFFESVLDDTAKHRYDVERELHQAIANGELRLFLQPQVDAAGKVVGAEALVRWQHPQRGLIPPGAFIPVAEESNLIIEIGTWVFTEVCRLLAHNDMATRSLRISVNISPRHFRQPGFVDQIKRGLAETGADPTHLTLEVTEGMLIDNIKEVIAKMTELSMMGIHFSMDDFGTGYSSLSYLKRLPIHELKIDKSFIQDLTVDPDDDALVETILAVARLMNLKVVAEGVETTAQADFLNQRGEVIHQGYLFGKPQQAELVIAEIARNGN